MPSLLKPFWRACSRSNSQIYFVLKKDRCLEDIALSVFGAFFELKGFTQSLFCSAIYVDAVAALQVEVHATPGFIRLQEKQELWQS